jgi:hypothetical protein
VKSKNVLVIEDEDWKSEKKFMQIEGEDEMSRGGKLKGIYGKCVERGLKLKK